MNDDSQSDRRLEIFSRRSALRRILYSSTQECRSAEHAQLSAPDLYLPGANGLNLQQGYPFRSSLLQLMGRAECVSRAPKSRRHRVSDDACAEARASPSDWATLQHDRAQRIARAELSALRARLTSLPRARGK